MPKLDRRPCLRAKETENYRHRLFKAFVDVVRHFPEINHIKLLLLNAVRRSLSCSVVYPVSRMPKDSVEKR